MSILAVGPEDEAWVVFTGSKFYETSSPQINTTRTRAGAVTNNANSIRFPLHGAYDDMWFHVAARVGSHANTGNPTLTFYDNANTRGVVRMIATGNPIFKWQYFSGGVWTDLSGSTFTTTSGSGQKPLDIYVKLGSGGSVLVYEAGSLLYSFSGTITTDSATFDSIVMGGSAGSGFQNIWSQMIAATENTIGFELETLELNAAGDVNTWTSGSYTSIDESQINTADYLESNTVGHEFLGNIDALSPLSGATIRAVCVTAYASITSGATPADVAWLVKHDGVEYDLAELDIPKTGVNTVGKPLILDDAPDLSDWDSTKIGAFQIGVRTV